MSRTPDHRPAFGPSAVAASLVAAIACVVGPDIPPDASRITPVGDRALSDRISAVADTLRSFDSDRRRRAAPRDAARAVAKLLGPDEDHVLNDRVPGRLGLDRFDVAS